MAARFALHVRRQIVGYIALFVALGGAAYAAIPDSGGVIHGCYGPPGSGGVHPLYVIDTSSTPSCPAGSTPFTPLNWNATGPPGPQGAQGQQGPAGAPGTNASPTEPDLAGAKGLPSGTVKAVHTVKTVKATPGQGAAYLLGTQAHCPSKHPTALNGGWTALALRQDPSDGPPLELQSKFLIEVYSNRLPSRLRGKAQGWTAEVNVSFVTSQLPNGWELRVWALCGAKRMASQIGVPLSPAH
jgi:hypothetical protein